MRSTTDIIRDDPADTGTDDETRRTVQPFVSNYITHVHPSSTLREAARVMRADDVGLAVVSDENTIVGVLSERDIVGAVSDGVDVDVATVKTVETEDVLWTTPTTTIDDAAEFMMQRNIRHLLIGDGLDDLDGVVSMRDLLTAYLV